MSLILSTYTYIFLHIVCTQPDYKKTVLSHLSGLKTLDDVNLYLDDKMTEFLSQLTPSDDVNNFNPHPDPWFNQQLIRTSLTQSYDNVNKRAESVNRDIDKHMKNINKSFQDEVDDVIQRLQHTDDLPDSVI